LAPDRIFTGFAVDFAGSSVIQAARRHCRLILPVVPEGQ
jgi:hypothetical protein